MSLKAIMGALFGLLALTIPAAAQDSVCAELVERALAGLGEQCGGLQRNSVCYGHRPVDVSFAADVNADFSRPGDRAPAAQMLELTTSGLSIEDGRFGVAALRLGAHLPASDGRPGIIMMLVGAVELIHDVEQSQIDVIGEPISTGTISSTTLYAQQSKIAEVSGQLEPDTIALVDAISSDGDWLRVISEDGVAWAESADLAYLAAMEALPMIDTGDPFAWRHFSFSSSTELPQCAAAENMLVIQTPADLSANLRVNGADIHIDSLVSFQQLHSNALGMTVHRGSATNTAGETISAGHSVIGILAGGDIQAWSGALPASEAELARGERAQIALNGLARANGWEEFDTAMVAGAIIHKVVAGDTLYALARVYDVPVAEIVAANTQSTALRLLVGEELLIPNPGSGFSGLPQASPNTAPQPAQQSSQPDCSGLRLTSPQHAATSGPSPYYWDGIAAATGYRVDVYDHSSGALLASLHSGAGQTTVTLSAGELRVGGALQWEVTALVDGQAICSTGRSQPLIHVSS